jgi:hypothetical protein
MSTQDFDLEGVSKHLTNKYHLDAFRKTALAPGVKPYLPVANQAEIAKWIVEDCAKKDLELTGERIKQRVSDALSSVLSKKRKADSQTAKQKKMELTEEQVMKAEQEEFVRDINRAWSTGVRVADLAKQWPKTEKPMLVSSSFMTALADLLDLAKRLDEAGLAQ